MNNLVHEADGQQWLVHSEESVISVTAYPRIGNASANLIDGDIYPPPGLMKKLIAAGYRVDQHWVIARVIVRTPEMRGRGIGKRMMHMLLEAVVKTTFQVVMVAPGGYNFDQDGQFEFYRKCGFVEVLGQKGLFYWTPAPVSGL